MSNAPVVSITEELVAELAVLAEHNSDYVPVSPCEMKALLRERAEMRQQLHAAMISVDNCELFRKDAERYQWLRGRWGRVGETYEAGTPVMSEIFDEPDGWETDGDSLDRCIDAARAQEGQE